MRKFAERMAYALASPALLRDALMSPVKELELTISSTPEKPAVRDTRLDLIGSGYGCFSVDSGLAHLHAFAACEGGTGQFWKLDTALLDWTSAVAVYHRRDQKRRMQLSGLSDLFEYIVFYHSARMLPDHIPDLRYPV
ncbi:hypothetical protein S7711_11037 [Stachybotrys chartarum IBT 7711]|uniref:Uncharacterized protein n=1 Tax=Stachybotrys chartarum (strain CBS 109288 / IBT 7711) TaxID=1280523 RepID=A0A084AX94_STACB|nr:hypothetical protein S7711_11037 [Stachybotrys chartarum IBT 7711]KFA49974.1 hypothetical protein S40293_10487 [Stachybotrys chartarum IBT 40293]